VKEEGVPGGNCKLSSWLHHGVFHFQVVTSPSVLNLTMLCLKKFFNGKLYTM
jgi:hypothetical protein